MSKAPGSNGQQLGGRGNVPVGIGDFGVADVGRQGEDMTIGSLFEFWNMALPYIMDERNPDELKVGPNRLVEWDVEEIVNRVTRRVNGN